MAFQVFWLGARPPITSAAGQVSVGQLRAANGQEVTTTVVSQAGVLGVTVAHVFHPLISDHPVVEVGDSVTGIVV